jgi:DNA-binding response OmpR family regulator
MERAQRGDRGDRTALVVDDDPFIVAALAELLEEHGFDVHTATNGFSALRLAAELRPVVVLLDIALPERSGKDLLRDFRLEPATHDMAIVIVTGHADGLSDSDLVEADGIVPKPFDEGDLLLTVQRAVLRAANRRAEVAPVAATGHQAAAKGARRPVPGRRRHQRQSR